jgi:hypothetical protein
MDIEKLSSLYAAFGNTCIFIDARFKSAVWEGEPLKVQILKLLRKDFATQKETKAWFARIGGEWNMIFQRLCALYKNEPWLEVMDLRVRAHHALKRLSKTEKLEHPLIKRPECYSSLKSKFMHARFVKKIWDLPWTEHDSCFTDKELWSVGLFSIPDLSEHSMQRLFDAGRFRRVYTCFWETWQQCIKQDRTKPFKMSFTPKEEGGEDIPSCGITLQLDSSDVLCVSVKKFKLMKIFDDGGAIFVGKDRSDLWGRCTPEEALQILQFIERLNDDNDFWNTIMQNVGACCFCGRSIT